MSGVPVTITCCPLCNTSIVFERTLEGKGLSFGVSGKPRKSDIIIYDRESQSWWQQYSGEAITGAYCGKLLKLRPARREPCACLNAHHSNGRVLVPSRPAMRDYGRNPYTGYDRAANPFLYRGPLPEVSTDGPRRGGGSEWPGLGGRARGTDKAGRLCAGQCGAALGGGPEFGARQRQDRRGPRRRQRGGEAQVENSLRRRSLSRHVRLLFFTRSIPASRS